MRQDHDGFVVPTLPCPNESCHARRLRRIAAFSPAFRAPIEALVARATAVEDLADSFPGLLFAIATGYGDTPARARAMSLIAAGAPLRTAADALGLPLWLKRLPAGAFTEPLRRVPADEEFASRIHALVPDTAAAAAWLSRMLLANEVCGREPAAWIARQFKTSSPAPTDPGFLHLLAWIWHADRPAVLSARLLRRRWQPQFSARRSAEEVEHWRQRMALAIALGDGVEDTWLAEGHCRGFDFVTLRTAEDFITEAARMDNCLDQYAHRLEGRAVRIFSIRKDGRSVADLEIACHEQELGMPAIAQLRAARNRRADMDIWQAAYAWLGNQPIRPADPALLRQDRSKRTRTAAKLWRPFLQTLEPSSRQLFAHALGTRTQPEVRSRQRAACPVGVGNGAASMRPRTRSTASARA